jgi:hypothetical protein
MDLCGPLEAFNNTNDKKNVPRPGIVQHVEPVVRREKVSISGLVFFDVCPHLSSSEIKSRPKSGAMLPSLLRLRLICGKAT